MAINPEAYVFRPFNAANTLALSEELRGARNHNAASELQLQREQNPNSLLNRGREANVNAAEQTVRSAQLQNAIPALTSARQMLGSVRETIENKGAAAGRQMLNRQLWSMKNQGILPEDFDLGLDPGELSDEEFAQDVMQSEQDLTSMLAPFQAADDEMRMSAAIGDMQALGYPMTREGFQEYNQDRGSGTSEGLEALIQEARFRGILMDQERSARDEAREEQGRERERAAERQNIVRNLEQNRMAVDLTERLEGTMLESGSFLPADMRRSLADLQGFVMGLAGRDTSGISEMVADFDTQRKVLQDQVNSRIASGDYGRSATQLSSIERSLASPDISPQAIIRIQGQLGQMDLDRADADDIEIENRDQWEQRVKEWKNYDPVGSSIPRMNLSQLRQLNIDELSDDQAQSALKRLDELENGR